MAAFDITRSDVAVQDTSHSQRDLNSFDIDAHRFTVGVNGVEKRTRNQFDVIEHGFAVGTFSSEKRDTLTFGITSVGQEAFVFDFDRLGEFAERFTTVTFNLEYEDTGDPIENGVFLFTNDGQTAVGEITDSKALLTLLNEKPHQEFFVMVNEEGTEFLEFAFHVAGSDPDPVLPPGDVRATLTVRRPSLDLRTVMGRGDVLEELRGLLREEFTRGLQG